MIFVKAFPDQHEFVVRAFAANRKFRGQFAVQLQGLDVALEGVGDELMDRLALYVLSRC
jgi:hypothetical protein